LPQFERGRVIPPLLMRIATIFLALILGVSGAFFTFASFYDGPSGQYAVATLLPCAALIWALPTGKRPKKKTR
jgi:hypothetical protein